MLFSLLSTSLRRDKRDFEINYRRSVTVCASLTSRWEVSSLNLYRFNLRAHHNAQASKAMASTKLKSENQEPSELPRVPPSPALATHTVVKIRSIHLVLYISIYDVFGERSGQTQK